MVADGKRLAPPHVVSRFLGCSQVCVQAVERLVTHRDGDQFLSREETGKFTPVIHHHIFHHKAPSPR